MEDGTTVEPCGAAVFAAGKAKRGIARSTNRKLRISNSKEFPEAKKAEKSEEKSTKKTPASFSQKTSEAKNKLLELLKKKREEDSNKNIRQIAEAAKQMASQTGV